jgi:PAS domain S-box-containing protein
MFSVLYVDDELNLLELTKLFLEFKGEFSVDTKTSAQDGLDLLKNRAYDAVISDFQMPGMDGIEFLKIVRSTFDDLPFILFTGKGREEVVIEAIDNGVDFYIQKGEDARSQFARLENKIKLAVQRKCRRDTHIHSDHQIYDFINFLPDAIFAIDKQGAVIAWNKAIEEMTGVAAVEMLGKNHHEYARVIYGENCPALIDLVFNSDATIEQSYPDLVRMAGDVIIAETQGALPQGLSRTLSRTAIPLRDNKRNIVGALESIRDITLQKNAEIALLEHETRKHAGVNSRAPEEQRDYGQKIEEITASLPGVVFQYYIRPNNEKGVCFVNEQVSETIFGFDHSDKNFFRWFTGQVHPDDRDMFIGSVDDSQKKAESWNVEGRFIKPSGETIWFCGMGSPVVHGDELVYSGILLDITEKKTAEEKLRESEEKFRSLVEHSPESILIVDSQGTILFANNAVVRTIEARDCTSLIGRNVIDFIAPESREDMAREFMQISRGSGSCLAHYSFLSAQGKKIRVESLGTMIVYEGKIAAFLSIRDITESKRVEDNLKNSEEQLHLLFNKIDDGMALCEIIPDEEKKASDYRILEINDSFERQLGISRTSVIGKTSREAYNITEPPYLDIFARVADSGKPETFETYFSPLRKYFRISVYSPRKNQFATVFYDITERKQTVAALLQANRQLNLMTSLTRHDILNNVSAILGYLSILRMKFSNPALTGYFSKLEDLTTATQRLILDTQTYQNLGISEPKWQDMDKLVRHLQIPDDIALIVDLQGVEIYSDPMLEKVFLNLLDNSIRHGERVTEIRVSSHQSDEEITVVWEDNGIGIPNEEKEKIFEKGYGKNTGLGLFLCREILSITGMTIQETGEPGKGARFEIMVPAGVYRYMKM